MYFLAIKDAFFFLKMHISPLLKIKGCDARIQSHSFFWVPRAPRGGGPPWVSPGRTPVLKKEPNEHIFMHRYLFQTWSIKHKQASNEQGHILPSRSKRGRKIRNLMPPCQGLSSATKEGPWDQWMTNYQTDSCRKCRVLRSSWVAGSLPTLPDWGDVAGRSFKRGPKGYILKVLNISDFDSKVIWTKNVCLRRCVYCSWRHTSKADMQKPEVVTRRF